MRSVAHAETYRLDAISRQSQCDIFYDAGHIIVLIYSEFRAYLQQHFGGRIIHAKRANASNDQAHDHHQAEKKSCLDGTVIHLICLANIIDPTLL